jgi:hypothetical protein
LPDPRAALVKSRNVFGAFWVAKPSASQLPPVTEEIVAVGTNLPLAVFLASLM